MSVPESNASVQTLGVSGATPRSDSRLKSHFWPAVENATDVDYLGNQGYWICAIVAVFSFAVAVMMASPITALVVVAYYFLGGVGVRQGSVYAAVLVLAMFLADLFLSPFSVLRIILTAVLLSNVRAIWIASRWNPTADEAVAPPRMDETLADKFADQLPMWLWPKIRIVYYAFASIVLALSVIGLVLLKLRLISR